MCICEWMGAVFLPAIAAVLTDLFTSDHCWRNNTVSKATLDPVCVPMSQVMPQLAPGWRV